METMKDIPKLKDHGFADDAEIAINCEWVGNSSVSINPHF
jgi:hexokinase